MSSEIEDISLAAYEEEEDLIVRFKCEMDGEMYGRELAYPSWEEEDYNVGTVISGVESVLKGLLEENNE